MSLTQTVEDLTQKLNPIFGPIKAKVTQAYQDGETQKDKATIPKVPIDPILNGDDRGIYSLPKIGSYIRIGFYQNDPNLPYIDSQLGDNLSLSLVKYGELILSHSAKAAMRIDERGSWYQVAKKFFLKVGKKTDPFYQIEMDPELRRFRVIDKQGNRFALDSKNGALKWEIVGEERVSVAGASSRVMKKRNRVVDGNDELIVKGLAQYGFLNRLKFLVTGGVRFLIETGVFQVTQKTGVVTIDAPAGSVSVQGGLSVSVTSGTNSLSVTPASISMSVGTTSVSVTSAGVAIN